jgi:PAS domain S-box-containing protein
VIEFADGRGTPRAHPRRVLVTGDSPSLAHAWVDALRQIGTEPCEAIESHRAFEVQERLGRGDIDAVVADVAGRGPAITGIVTWLTTVAPDVPVVVIARAGTEDDLVLAIADGADEVLLGAPAGEQVGRAVRLAVSRHLFRRRASRSVAREIEERYRYLFDRNPHPMWVYDLDTLQFLAVNDAAVWQYGFSRDEFGAMTIRDIRPPADIPQLLASVASVKAGSQPERTRWRHRRKNGTIVPVDVLSSPIIFSGRRAELVIAIDVTDQIAAQQAREASERRYRDIFENAIDVIFTADLDLRVTGANAAAEALTGYPRDQMIGRSVFTLIPREDRERVNATLQRLLEDGRVVLFEVAAVTASGERRALEVSASIVREGVRAVGIQGIARDLTDRRRLEAQLRQSQKMEGIGQLAGGLAHDFSNHLTVILGCARALEARLPQRDPLREEASEIADAARRAAGITRQLLAFGRRQSSSPTVLDLGVLVRDLESMLRRLIGEDIDLVVRLDPALGRIKAERNQIEQVALNLAVNARDAMPKGGRLTIEVRNVDFDSEPADDPGGPKSGAFVRLTVADTGIGMDLTTQRRIFEPFFTTKEHGSGLGLSTVYGIVRQNSGRIGVSSERGQGTVFRLYFPRLAEGEPDASLDSARGGSTTLTGRENVLVVEDDNGVREFVRSALGRAGYTVSCAATPAEALEIVKPGGHRIDLLLVDLVLPGSTGAELATVVAGLAPGVKVLFTSGYDQDAIERRGVPGFDAPLLPKPFTVDALLEAVRDRLDR